MTVESQFTPPEQEITLPVPKIIGWRVLIQPYTVSSVTPGGIELPDETVENQKYLVMVGKIVGMGALAYKSEKLADPNNPVVGSWVLYGQYSGQKVRMADGRTFVVMNDNNVLGAIDNPEDYHSIV